MCICIGLCACICICICIRRRYMFMHRNKYTRRCRCGLVCTHVNTRLCSHRHTSTTLRREAPESDIFIVRHCPMFQCRTIKTGSCHYTPLRTYANTQKHFHAHTHTHLHTDVYVHMYVFTPDPSGALALGIDLMTTFTLCLGSLVLCTCW